MEILVASVMLSAYCIITNSNISPVSVPSAGGTPGTSTAFGEIAAEDEKAEAERVRSWFKEEFLHALLD